MLFRASSMPRLVPCPGSNLLEADYPDDDTEAADEGSVAHQVAAETLSGNLNLSAHLGRSINNIFVDQEMLFHLELYIKECTVDMDKIIEHQYLMMFEGHSIQGTPDFWYYDLETSTLHIKDLKYGFGWVEAYENWQLLCYAMLVLYSYPQLRDIVKRVKLSIIQPRAGHPEGPVRGWEFDADLMRNYSNFILGAVQKAAITPPPVQTGAHCRYCKALLACNGATAAAGYAVDYACNAGTLDMTPEQFSIDIEVCQRSKKMLEQRIIALEELGMNMCKKGTVLSGWEARPTVGPLKWRGDRDVVKIAGAMKKDIKQPVRPITPTQAIQRGLLSEDVVKRMASRSTGGMKLKRVDHARAKRILSNG